MCVGEGGQGVALDLILRFSEDQTLNNGHYA